MEVGGIRFIGVNEHTGEKILFTLALIAAFLLVRLVLKALTHVVFTRVRQTRVRFWTRQGIDVATSVFLVLGLASIWFDDPKNLATGVGLASAGLAFALQKVVTSLAGYLVILRGKTFNVGDRITMGGVRGDVIALGFIQTTIMEMGQPASVQGADPAVWVEGRQFTGRIVTVTNSTIFDEPVYNYSRDFPIIWEEMRLPVTYTCDRAEAERILLAVATEHTRPLIAQGAVAIENMMRRFTMQKADLEPRVFYRITDNWLELGLRFLAPAHGARALKDGMSRAILAGFDAAGIGIASATYDIVGFPPLRRQAPSSAVDGPTVTDDDRLARRTLAAAIVDGANLDLNYVALTLASCAIASFGLLENSVAVIIGAMIIAPLMSVIQAVAYGALEGDAATFRRGAITLGLGVVGAVALSALLTRITGLADTGSEILSRTRPNVLDLGIAIAAGAIGSFARVRPSIANTIAGTAIAVALMPPLCVVGIGIARADRSIAQGAALLFSTNLLGITLASMIVFLVAGLARRRALPAIAWTAALTAIIVVPLAFSFRELFREAALTTALRTALTRTVTLRGAVVVSNDVDWLAEPPIARIGIRSNVIPTAHQVADLEAFARRATGQHFRLVLEIAQTRRVTATGADAPK